MPSKDQALEWANAYYKNLKLIAGRLGLDDKQYSCYKFEQKSRLLFIDICSKTTKKNLINEALSDYNHISGLLKIYYKGE